MRTSSSGRETSRGLSRFSRGENGAVPFRNTKVVLQPLLASIPHGRRGYTLLELLIVVAVLSIVVALVMPAMRGPLRKSQLQEAARQVRVELAKARLAAIESGTPWQFRFQPGTGRFDVVPNLASDDAGPLASTQSDGFADPGLADVSSSTAFASRNETTRHELPDGICFWTESSGGPAPSDSETIIFVDASQTQSSDGGQWSVPIVFYPNGRTGNARVRLSNLNDDYIDVTLRGLTGSATIGKLSRQVLEEPASSAPSIFN